MVTWVYEQGSFIPCAKIIDNEVYSIISDYIGRPVLAFDKNGEKVWSAEYDIYGKIRNLKGDRNFVPFRQLGQYEDEETGLYYNRFRYYNPETGLYISKDPIGLLGGFALYGYVKDVNSFVDIFGLEELFRAVFKAEYDDIIKNKIIRNTGGQYETGKLFATNFDDATTFGEMLRRFENSDYKVIKVNVPDDVNIYYFHADGMKAASIDNSDLSKLKIECY